MKRLFTCTFQLWLINVSFSVNYGIGFQLTLESITDCSTVKLAQPADSYPNLGSPSDSKRCQSLRPT
jgi:hypothetical protein